MCSPPHLDKGDIACPQYGWAPASWGGGQGGWHTPPKGSGKPTPSLLSSSTSLANFWGAFPIMEGPPPSLSLPVSTGLQGTQRLQGEFGGGDMVLPHGWVLSGLHLILWPLHLTGGEGQARHRWCGRHEGNPQPGEGLVAKAHASGEGWWTAPGTSPDISR